VIDQRTRDDDQDGQTDGGEPQPAVQGHAMRRHERRLRQEDEDPGGEDGSVQDDEGTERRER
jgi:hypothetical protein